MATSSSSTAHGSATGAGTGDAALRAPGHDVVTPTLTASRAQPLLRRDVGLDAHVHDIVNVLEFEDLHDVILVGHSYGGLVVTGVAERLPHRVRRSSTGRLVPIDEDRSMATCPRYSPGLMDPLEALTQADGEGWMVPTPGGPEYPLPLPDADGVGRRGCHAAPGEDPVRRSRDRQSRRCWPSAHVHHLPDARPAARFAPFAERRTATDGPATNCSSATSRS